MPTPEFTNKTFYFNGVPIGELPMTGDADVDIEIARKFLKEKGLYKETELVPAMLQQAISFGKIARLIYDGNLSTVPSNPIGIIPFVVNSAFSIELYLKTLAQIHNTPLRGHKLLDLYDELSAVAKQQIEAQTKEYKTLKNFQGNIDLRAHLEDLNNAFTEWRYAYEFDKVTLVRPIDAFVVLDVLHRSCVNQPKT